MLRIVHAEDPVRALEEAYLEARAKQADDTESLRTALKQARMRLPTSSRVYDLKRRTEKALERFQAMRAKSRGPAKGRKVVPLPSPKIVQMFPDSAPRISA